MLWNWSDFLQASKTAGVDALTGGSKVTKIREIVHPREKAVQRIVSQRLGLPDSLLPGR